MRARRRMEAERAVYAAGAILHGHRLRSRGLLVELDAAAARQHIRDLAMDEVAAVELGGDLHGKAKIAPRRLDLSALRHGADKISAKAHERAHASGDDALAGLDRVQALVARRRKAVLFGQLVERHKLGLLG